MATNYVQDGNSIEVTLSKTVSAGEVDLVGNTLVVYANGGVSGDVVTAYTEGVFEVTKYTDGTTDSISQGADVYWDASDSSVSHTDDTSTNQQCGKAWADAANNSTTVLVKLNA